MDVEDVPDDGDDDINVVDEDVEEVVEEVAEVVVEEVVEDELDVLNVASEPAVEVPVVDATENPGTVLRTGARATACTVGLTGAAQILDDPPEQVAVVG